MIIMTTKEELMKMSLAHADTANISLNPNTKIVDAIFTGLLRNEEKHGDIYCPCRMLENNPVEDKKKVCPCVWHLDEIKADGRCHCMLFVKKVV